VRVAVATLQYGRREHLERQAVRVRELAGVDRYLVVSMDDAPPAPEAAEVMHLPADDADQLPLSAARNAAIAHLDDCDLVVLLDVDCIPDPALVEAYAEASRAVGRDRTVLLGPVGWLSAPAPAGGPIGSAVVQQARATVKRSFPAAGTVLESRPELFWSLSFAVSPATHRAIGGFDEAFTGWGAEDTDYGRRAHRREIALWKVGGAWSYHQPHPPARETPGQIAALVANAIHFHQRWGDWPMPDVLAELSAAARVVWSADHLSVAPPPDPSRVHRDGVTRPSQPRCPTRS
jgi:N-acetylglucosaminyl-diphospho-decaprenol L-rhamnosyltransferase